MQRCPIALSMLLLFMTHRAHAQQIGDPDSTFSADGITTTHFGPAGNDYGWAMAVQPDGRILLAGTNFVNGAPSFALVRYTTDGALDQTFGVGGKVTTSIPGRICQAAAIAVQPNGGIVVAGYADSVTVAGGFAVVRYNPDGTLDNTFSADGVEVTDVGPGEEWAHTVSIQPDGKIVIAGVAGLGVDPDFALVRYNTDGSLDNAFSGDGVQIMELDSSGDFHYAMVLQPDGRIVAGGFASSIGSGFVLARYMTDGTLDPTFGVNGITSAPIAGRVYAVAMQVDGKIVAVGQEQSGGGPRMAIARFNVDGTMDASFSSDGYLIITAYGFSWGRGVALMPDGDIIAAGVAEPANEMDFLVAVINTDGTLDNTFSTDGLQTTDIGDDDFATAAAVQPDGRILVAGYAAMPLVYNDMAVVRYLPYLNVGVLEFGSTIHGAVLIYPNPIGEVASLEYMLTSNERVSIRLVDVEGRTVRTFFENEAQQVGQHRIDLNFPRTIATGAYSLVVSTSTGKQSVVHVMKE